MNRIRIMSEIFRNSPNNMCLRLGGYNFSTGAKQTDTITKKKNVKTVPEQKITLVALDESISVTSLTEAQKLAKRRDLSLIKLHDMDTKTQRSIYKLTTHSKLLYEELHLDEKHVPDKKKSVQIKSLTIGSNIGEHDLASRLKNICKWLSKQYEIRIFIQGSGSDISSGEKILKTIEQGVSQPETIGKIVQKHVKGSTIKFNIVPTTPTTPAPPTQVGTAQS